MQLKLISPVNLSIETALDEEAPLCKRHLPASALSAARLPKQEAALIVLKPATVECVPESTATSNPVAAQPHPQLVCADYEL